MAKKSLSKYPIVLIEWNDAFNKSSEWHQLLEINTTDNYTVQSVGFLFYEDKEKIILIPHLAVEERDYACGTGIMIIPKGIITRRRKL